MDCTKASTRTRISAIRYGFINRSNLIILLHFHSSRGVIMNFRHGSNELDSSSSTERSRPVIPSLRSRAGSERQRRISLPITTDPSLRGGVTFCDGSNGQGLFFTIEPCLRYASSSSDTSDKQF